MNKSELIQQLSSRTKLSTRQVKAVVDELFDPNNGTIAKAIKKGDKVSLTGFGTFESRKRGARTFRNPQTGENVKAKAKKVPAFKAGASLKDTVK